MADFIKINEQGAFELNNRPFMVHCVVYFGRYPGTCIGEWLSDRYWMKNRDDLEKDFFLMQTLNINSIGLFINSTDLIEEGEPVESRMKRLDQVIRTAAAHNLRVVIFPIPFIDNPLIYRQLTGKEAPKNIDFWHATYSQTVFDAYIHVMSFFAERYNREPFVFGYMDRIDRFVSTYGRRDKVPGLELIWQDWLEKHYKSFSEFLKFHPKLVEQPKNFSQVKLPQDLPDGFSMADSRAYEYALMQKTLVGETQGKFDRAIKEIAPNQIMWTPFEGVGLMNPILDGYIPTPYVLEAIWAEFYPDTAYRSDYRVYLPELDSSCVLLQPRQFVDIPEYIAQAYLFTRFLKQSSQRPVILCHGLQIRATRPGGPLEYQRKILIDRTNRASLKAGGDGWAYWCWSDDAMSYTATMEESKHHREHWYFNGATMGLIRWNRSLRPETEIIRTWGRQLQSVAIHHPALAQDTLLLLPEPKMMIEQETLTLQTATSIMGALLRVGTLPQVQWTATTRRTINYEDIRSFRLVVIGDSTYRRDHKVVPEVLLEYVKQGGVLLWPVHSARWIEDEFGHQQPQKALSELAGCGKPSEKLDILKRPDHYLQWAIRQAFKNIFSTLQGTYSYTLENEYFTRLSLDAPTTEVIALAKFKEGNSPLFYRHRLGKGTSYVFTWTFNVFRDCGNTLLYGGDKWDWLLMLPLESAGIVPDLTTDLGVLLREQAYSVISQQPPPKGGGVSGSLVGLF